MQELVDLIEDDIAEASEKVKALRQMLPHGDLMEILSGIEASLDGYEADDALEGLLELARTLDIPL